MEDRKILKIEDLEEVSGGSMFDKWSADDISRYCHEMLLKYR